jgi:nickel transport protein
MGHRGQWVLPVADMQPAADTARTGSEKPAARDKPGRDAVDQPQLPATTARQALSGPEAKQIEAAVEKALDKKLKPLFKMVAELRQTGPTLTDVLGGIGYIIGLVGLAAYVRYRRKE